MLIKILLKMPAVLHLRMFLFHKLPLPSPVPPVLLLLPPAPPTNPSQSSLVNTCLDHQVSQQTTTTFQTRDAAYVKVVENHFKQGRLHQQVQQITRLKNVVY